MHYTNVLLYSVQCNRIRYLHIQGFIIYYHLLFINTLHSFYISGRFEDGTVSFLDIVALRHGFETLQKFRLTMNIISRHTFKLASYVYNKMAAMCHDNGNPLCILYHGTEGFSNIDEQGGIVTFNLLRKDTSIIGYSEV